MMIFSLGKLQHTPDANGSIGILFEQGSSRGHIQESVNGILTFPFHNQKSVNYSFFNSKGCTKYESQTT